MINDGWSTDELKHLTKVQFTEVTTETPADFRIESLMTARR
jgi:hypothetical protein